MSGRGVFFQPPRVGSRIEVRSRNDPSFRYPDAASRQDLVHHPARLGAGDALV